MNLETRTSTALRNECKLVDETLILEYVMNRKNAILQDHINNVCRIYEPGEGGQNYYMTKLTPRNRNHAGKIYGRTKEELENKIIAHYLHIQDDEKVTVRKALVCALGGNEENFGKTPKRTIQRFDKNLAPLSNIKLSKLTEDDIRTALDRIVSTKPSEKEFNETITALNKLADYCQYEHIDIINIREIVSLYRKIRLKKKHLWKMVEHQNKDLAFSRPEASKIVRYAFKHPSYKAYSIAILITTGLRAGELLALEIGDIYLDEGYIWIHQTEDTKTYELLDYVKENKTREVYLSDEAITVFRACMEFRSHDDNENPFLLLNPDPQSTNGKMHLGAIDKFMRRIIHTEVLGYGAEREIRSAHDCRRTYASLEYLSGTPINLIKEQLGHSTVDQTWKYIFSVVESYERRSQLKGGRLLFEEIKPQEPLKNVVDAVWTQRKVK